MTGRTGTCRLCGKEGELTFEHIPPRSAYNRDRVQLQTPEVVDGEGIVAVPGRYQQRGAGGCYLCGDCNNFLGREYVPDYMRFARIVGEALNRTPDLENVNDREDFPSFRLKVERLKENDLQIRPSSVIKQAVSMLLCVAAPGFAERREDLRAYVLDPESAALSDDVSLGMCFFLGAQARFGGPTARLDLGPPVTTTTYIEAAYPPLAWMMTLNGSSIPRGRADFSPWVEAPPDSTLNGFELEAQVGFAVTLFPGDYRTAGQLRAHLRNQEAADG